MKISELARNFIDRLPIGYVFTYSDFNKKVKNLEALSKALNRMAINGKIVKLAKGKFYKPEKTVFGSLEPDQYQVVKDLLERNGKVEGYLTGLSIYNKLGLTTQITNTIQIAKNEIRPNIKRGQYMIAFIKQKNTITKQNIPLLQILDTIRFLKKIPDSNEIFALKLIQKLIIEKEAKKLDRLVGLALKYPPSVRAILGMLIEQSELEVDTQKLKKSLNPLSVYKFSAIAEYFEKAEGWYIR